MDDQPTNSTSDSVAPPVVDSAAPASSSVTSPADPVATPATGSTGDIADIKLPGEETSATETPAQPAKTPVVSASDPVTTPPADTAPAVPPTEDPKPAV